MEDEAADNYRRNLRSAKANKLGEHFTDSEVRASALVSRSASNGHAYDCILKTKDGVVIMCGHASVHAFLKKLLFDNSKSLGFMWAKSFNPIPLPTLALAHTSVSSSPRKAKPC